MGGEPPVHTDNLSVNITGFFRSQKSYQMSYFLRVTKASGWDRAQIAGLDFLREADVPRRALRAAEARIERLERRGAVDRQRLEQVDAALQETP